MKLIKKSLLRGMQKEQIFPADSDHNVQLYTQKQICFTGKAITKSSRDPIHLLVSLQLLF